MFSVLFTFFSITFFYGSSFINDSVDIGAQARAERTVSLKWLVRQRYFLLSITQLVDQCKSCILIGYATRGLLAIVLERHRA